MNSNEQLVVTSLLNDAVAEGHQILHYWSQKVILPDGHFYGEVSSEGQPRANAPRSLIVAARILWTFSRAVTSGFADTAVYREQADKAYEDLTRHFWDPVYLGFYWMIDGEDQPSQPFKHVYGQSFAIYALAEYYAMSRRDEALKLAQLVYGLVEKYAADSDHQGYFEMFDEDWIRQHDLTGSPVNHGGPKSMNTHLHLLEAMTCLYQVWPSPILKARLAELLDIVRGRIVNFETKHFYLFFTDDWKQMGENISYGHDIEGSWLMLEAAEVLEDDKRIRACRQLAIEMVDAVLAKGIDADYGVMDTGRGEEIINGKKEWWQQAEAVVGCVNAYQISQDIRYLQSANNIWTFIQNKIIDGVNGEWRMQVNRDGKFDTQLPKVSPWKGPYHNTRACMELFHRLRRKT